MHEKGGKDKGHKAPSLIAKDTHNRATCLSRRVFQSADIFGVMAKMEGMDIRNDFIKVKKKLMRLLVLYKYTTIT